MAIICLLRSTPRAENWLFGSTLVENGLRFFIAARLNPRPPPGRPPAPPGPPGPPGPPARGPPPPPPKPPPPPPPKPPPPPPPPGPPRPRWGSLLRAVFCFVVSTPWSFLMVSLAWSSVILSLDSHGLMTARTLF